MSQGSSSGLRTRGRSESGVRGQLQSSGDPPRRHGPTEGAPGVGACVLDEVTGLPLIICPYCKDLRVQAATTMYSTENLGKRYFKCPRSRRGDSASCRMYKFEDQYKAYLYEQGYLGGTLASMDDLAELVEEIEALKEELASVKELGRNKQPRWSCVVLGCLNIFLLSFGILFFLMK